jgi:hypothetical protein
MSDTPHLDDFLRDWPYEPGQLGVRLVIGDDGREVLQMRIDMGAMQLETENRPDGERPHGEATYYDHLISLAVEGGEDFLMTEDQCAEVDREFVQYYHRRICWLGLREYRRAVDDAEHSLSLMDFCRAHATGEDWLISHEQYRPFVLFHHTQAVALAQLEEVDAEAAVQAVNQGLERFRDLFAEYEAEDQFDDDELVTRLVDLRETLRTEYEVGRTLRERLDDAVATEQYELAAKLRDELTRRQMHGR